MSIILDDLWDEHRVINRTADSRLALACFKGVWERIGENGGKDYWNSWQVYELKNENVSILNAYRFPLVMLAPDSLGQGKDAPPPLNTTECLWSHIPYPGKG